MMWTKYFNRIFVINLPEDTDRFEKCRAHLEEFDIPFQKVHGIKNENGEEGVRQTLLNILKSCKHMDRILVFEDDIRFVVNPNMIMGSCINQLRKLDWHVFSMGPNTHVPFLDFIAPNLLPMRECYGLHATAYSKAGIAEILKREVTNPIDVFLAAQIQPLGKCYCSYPLLATQHNGYSNIMKKEMDQSYIETRFYEHAKHLL